VGQLPGRCGKMPCTENICLATGKFGLCSNGLKTVFVTDLSVAWTNKSFVTTDFVRSLEELKVIEITDKFGCDNSFGPGKSEVFGILRHKLNFLFAQQILFFGVL
jgi:hypothetical protein